MTIAFRRIIRSRNTLSASLVGNTRNVESLTELIALAKRTRKVYAFVDGDGNEGTIRSGRRMRRVDAHVRNTITTAGAIQLPLGLIELRAA